MLIFAFVAISCPVAFAEAEKIYRTGLEAKKGRLAVSPDGRQLVFTTDRMTHGLRLLDLRSGITTMIPEGVGRNFGLPAWSPDGKQLAVVSAAVRNNVYSRDGMEIELLEVGTWKRRSIAAGDGVKIFPFFSADGKRVYYFKGERRESGRTPAGRYDLYAVDLVSGQETRLTYEEMYEVGKGDETQVAVLFHATPSYKKSIKDAQGKEGRNALFIYELSSGLLSLLPVDQSSGIFDFHDPLRDSAGNLYFISAKANPGGGYYLWFLVRTNREGKQAEILTELPISMCFGIAKNTGEIYVMDRKGEELIIRRLSAQAAH